MGRLRSHRLLAPHPPFRPRRGIGAAQGFCVTPSNSQSSVGTKTRQSVSQLVECAPCSPFRFIASAHGEANAENQRAPRRLRHLRAARYRARQKHACSSRRRRQEAAQVNRGAVDVHLQLHSFPATVSVTQMPPAQWSTLAQHLWRPRQLQRLPRGVQQLQGQEADWPWRHARVWWWPVLPLWAGEWTEAEDGVA